ncbi:MULTISPECIES: hypothetical protein [unclassified Streptomyces]|uniref:hypothetical protein n=1 Tax=unclassified Streptomyces TaxID=2593676 RepID=UPI00136EC30A|nr:MULTISPECIES: hypothetical protein [unclassified Streptomyces]NEA04489.1 hypothetical protein [Streptomyces sp. SID10116]MYY85158.1 hypothetical protein [Streptomyces sp. SID335]MYZ15181.1 hypothetical protein [Streptomyces sp. SID337]NDZ84830.1 hypothetical protein [Streptomyces sp. SID10115]NEB45938.1 hypothetical protein [Streptomyces sp. SID339]
MIFYETEADPTEWFLLPLHWKATDVEKIEQWAADCAEIAARRHRGWWKRPDKKALTARYRLLQEAHPNPGVPADQVFLYGGEPRQVPQPVYALTVQPDGEYREADLLKVVQATGVHPVRPPEVAPFHSDRLGEGFRCVRYFGSDDRLGVSVNYGWWSEEHRVYATLRSVSGDLGWFLAHLDVFDGFARSVWLNANPE